MKQLLKKERPVNLADVVNAVSQPRIHLCYLEKFVCDAFVSDSSFRMSTKYGRLLNNVRDQSPQVIVR